MSNADSPAFPPMLTYGSSLPVTYGISKREYFAAHAPITLSEVRDLAIQSGLEETTNRELINILVELRMIYADRMLAALAE